MQFPTKVIHQGQEPDKETGAIIPPVYLTSTYAQEAPGVFKGYDYTRAGNPNFTNLERTLAVLEGGEHATVFSSGLGATTALITSVLKQGDFVVGMNDLYGGTFWLFDAVFKKYGVRLELADLNDADARAVAFAQKPKMVVFETPTNPLLRIVDIAAVAKDAHAQGAMVVVDNTFATPYLLNPLALGADAVLHSTTKYIGGHSDVIGGAVVTNNTVLKEKLDFARMAVGLNPSPFDCWLVSRGVKTLAVRMEQHMKNAAAIVDALAASPKVKKLYYPGLATHAYHDVAAEQMRGFGGMVSVEFDLSLEAMKKMISGYKVFSLAESLGGVESLVDHPASMTHTSIPKAEREKMGLPDGLVHYSVGIEGTEDLVEDIVEGLAGC